MVIDVMPPGEDSILKIGQFLFNEGLPDFAELEGKVPRVDGRKAAEFIGFCLNEGYVWGAFKEGQMIGSMSAYVSQPWWGGEKYLRDGWIVVAQQHRSLDTFQGLMEAFETAAKSIGVRQSVLTVSNMKDREKKEKLLSRCGYDQAMAFYRKGIEP